MIIFFCDASPTIGFGHLNRCLTLADTLYSFGEPCVMLGPSKKYNQSSKKPIFKRWVEQGDVWKSSVQAAELLVEVADEYSSCMVVLDDYRVDDEFQRRLKKSNIRYLLFDNGKREKIYADVILNTNPIVSKDNYKHKLLNSKAALLLGPKYSVLRSEFPPSVSKSTNLIKKVLITFGGGDDRGAILFVLDVLLKKQTKGIEFIVVSGKNNPNNHNIDQWIKSYGFGNVDLQINPDFIAELFASCDFAIMAGGSTVYEIASIGLPMILIAIADNQVKHSHDWSQVSESIKFLGNLEDLQTKTLVEAFNQFASSQPIRHNQTSKKIVDGLGRFRVASEIVKVSKKI